MKNRNRRNQAFTIIELLVVITILVLLIAILLPALRTAKETTRRMLCASNTRQVLLALGMYAYEDTDGDGKPEALPGGHWATAAA